MARRLRIYVAGGRRAVRYDAAHDLLTLTDRKTNATRWNYDKFGYATNKIDAASNTVFGKSDPDKWPSRGGCAGKQP